MSTGRDDPGERVVGVETLSQNIRQTICQEEADMLKELKKEERLGFEEKVGGSGARRVSRGTITSDLGGHVNDLGIYSKSNGIPFKDYNK